MSRGNNNKVEPLLCILSPRDIPEVLHGLNGINKYDKLWVKYHDNPNAHRLAKQYFLDHKQYTHVVRIPDDILLRQEHIDQLVNDIETHPEIECISGVGNYNTSPTGMKVYGVCMDDIPAKEKSKRVYNFIKIRDAPKSDIYKVKFGGGYAAFFSRRLLEDGIISWQTDMVAEATKRYNTIPPYKNEITCCNDVVISHELNDAGISEYVDFGVVVHHMKYSVPASMYHIGKKEPYVRLEPKTAIRSKYRPVHQQQQHRVNVSV